VYQYLTHDQIYTIAVFLFLLVLIALHNAWILRRAGRHRAPQLWPRVSILVPARDEEGNIERCVRSLLSQDYVEYEVWVLDDESADATGAILASLAAGDPRLHVLEGQPKPEGWLGKNWACAQLAEEATGELLLFTDADTFHAPDALRAVVTAMEGERADMLSGFVYQEVPTWGEKLLVPFLSWAMYCFTPLWLSYRIRMPSLSTASGQLLMVRRDTYQAIGGHTSVRSGIVEDLALARQFRAHSYRWRMMSAIDLISCRMYHSGREAMVGLSKNLFAVFDCRILPYLFIWLWLLLAFIRPLGDLVTYARGAPLNVPLSGVLWCILAAEALWWFPYQQLRLPLGAALFYPATVLAMEAVAFRSLWWTLSGRLTWKGRALPRPRIRWF